MPSWRWGGQSGSDIKVGLYRWPAKRWRLFVARRGADSQSQPKRTSAPSFKTQDAGTALSVLTMQDRDMLARYLTLSLVDRKTVCDVVVALAVAATVKAR